MLEKGDGQKAIEQEVVKTTKASAEVVGGIAAGIIDRLSGLNVAGERVTRSVVKNLLGRRMK